MDMKQRGFEIISKYQEEGLSVPQRATKGAAGYDFQAAETVVVPSLWKLQQAGENPKPILVKTGIKAYMPDSEYLELVSRSSNPLKRFLLLANGVGVIDSDYYNSDNEGHIFAKLTNDSNEEKTVQIKAGEGFMQGIFVEYGITVDDAATDVRNGGFGSTTK